MSANWEGLLDVVVNLDAPPSSAQGFGIPLLAHRSLGAGFTERVRAYTKASEAAADTDLSAAALAALNAIFSQSPKVSKVLVGRIEDDVAQLITWTFSGTIEVGDKLKIVVDEIETEYTAVSTTLNDEVDALRAALVTALAALDLTVGGASPAITITADTAGEPFDYSSLVTPVAAGDIAVAEVETNANVGLDSEFDAILANNDTWYAVIPGSRTAIDLKRAAAWAEANERFALLQTSDADVLTSVTTDVASTLKALNYLRTAVVWHSDDAEHLAAGWAGKKLAADPDTQTTQWDKCTLSGVTPDTLTTTQKTNAEAKNASLYLPAFGKTIMNPGKRINGGWIDELITADWTRARIRERAFDTFVRESDANRKIPFTDAGISVFVGVVLGVLSQGATAGHFIAGTEEVDAPSLVGISDADKLARSLSMEFSVAPQGAVHDIKITGSVSVVYASRLTETT